MIDLFRRLFRKKAKSKNVVRKQDNIVQLDIYRRKKLSMKKKINQ